MKDMTEISNNIKESFKSLSGYSISNNTVIDHYVTATSDSIEDAYIEIEKNKNPHIYTDLDEEAIDELGYMLNIPKRDGEDYQTYHYRLLNWRAHYETGNFTSIHDSLLNLSYSSNATYVPMTKGTGTGTVYIIPKEYNEENRTRSIEEVIDRLEMVKSPDSYVDYKIVEKIPVDVYINILHEKDVDIDNIKNKVELEIKEYINNIWPGDYLSYMDILRKIMNIENVKYINISQIEIDGKTIDGFEVMQRTDRKFILNNVHFQILEEGDINA